MGMFHAASSMLRGLSVNFDELARTAHDEDAPGYAISFEQAEAADPRVLANIPTEVNGKDAALDEVVGACSLILNEAMRRACEYRKVPYVVQFSGIKDEPGKLCVMVDPEEIKKFPGVDIKIPAHVTGRELGKVEDIIFKDWKECKVDGDERLYVTKTFDNYLEADFVASFLEKVGAIYGNEPDIALRDMANKEKGRRTLIMSEEDFALIARREEMECTVKRYQ